MKREIEPEMIGFLEAKLKDNGLYHQAVKDRLPRIIMAEASKVCVGIREATGNNDGKMIKLIQETVGGAYGEPYCAAGVMTMIAFAEYKTGFKSTVPATELAQDIWWKTPVIMRVKQIPLPGAIIVWGDVGSHTGHTEIVLAADESRIWAVGFNTTGTTSPNGPVDRNGNGVFFTIRSYKSTPSRKYLGCVKPF